MKKNNYGILSSFENFILQFNFIIFSLSIYTYIIFNLYFKPKHIWLDYLFYIYFIYIATKNLRDYDLTFNNKPKTETLKKDEYKLLTYNALLTCFCIILLAIKIINMNIHTYFQMFSYIFFLYTVLNIFLLYSLSKKIKNRNTFL